MDTERAIAMGKAEDLKQQLLAAKLEMEELKDSIRVLLMPHIEPEDFDLERHIVLSSRLVGLAAEYRTQAQQLGTLKQKYGLK